MITIISPFGAVEVPIADLNTYERNALAQLLGISGARQEAFQVLRNKKIFQKIKQEQVWKLCPKFFKFPTTFTLEHINNTLEGEDMKLSFKELFPEATISAAIHTLGGYCKCCKKNHSITRPAVMVKTIVHGIIFSNLYEGRV
jgi:hypothetical protein